MSETEQNCEHKFVYLRSIQKQETGGYNICYTRIDYFFCEKCLVRREVKSEEYAREKPVWFE